jgi:putative Ca2+/H+ antiporter (TMEM165/GDT1 family)
MALFAATFAGVLSAELVGDKTLFTMRALASRHPAPGLLAGGGAAVAVKMLAGVTLGTFIARLPPWLVSACTAATFFGMAVAFCSRLPLDAGRGRRRPAPPVARPSPRSVR